MSNVTLVILEVAVHHGDEESPANMAGREKAVIHYLSKDRRVLSVKRIDGVE